LWWKQQDFFTEADSVNLPGHPHGSLLTDIETYAQWLHDYIRKRDYKDTFLIGHCLGGYIAACYALKYPEETKGMALSGLGHCPMKEPARLAELKEAVRGEGSAWSNRLRQHYEKVPTDERVHIIGQYRRQGPMVQLNDLLCCCNFDITSHLGKIPVPTLVISGKNDSLTPPKSTRLLVGQIPGARQEIIKGAHHHTYLEKPADYNRVLNNFIGKLSS
jgi:pimeloyl-ACP methyl ester carboxylesterase